ncbi:MAG: bacteriohemerythrin [Planctomycetota bacterium]
MSSTIRFDEQMITGDQEIDAQHREWVDIANVLMAIERPSAAGIAFTDAAFRLVRYSRHHFRTEEALMERIGYPRLDQQRVDHARIMAVLERCFDDNADQTAFMRDMKRLLCEWVDSHLLEEDMLLRDFLQQREPSTEG